MVTQEQARLVRNDLVAEFNKKSWVVGFSVIKNGEDYGVEVKLKRNPRLWETKLPKEKDGVEVKSVVIGSIKAFSQ